MQIDKLKQRIQNAQALMLDAELSLTEYCKGIRSTLASDALIAATGAGSGTSKKKKGQQNADLFSWMPPSGTLSNQIIEILKNLSWTY